MTPLEREKNSRLFKEWQEKKDILRQDGDTCAKWTWKNGKVINIGEYPEEFDAPMNPRKREHTRCPHREQTKPGTRRMTRLQSEENLHRSRSSSPRVHLPQVNKASRLPAPRERGGRSTRLLEPTTPWFYSALLHLPCIYTNADQFINKCHELKTLIETRKPLVISITEINYKSRNHVFEEAEISLQGYVLYHNLQEQHTRRGICLWIHNSMKSAGLPDLENSFKEAIFCGMSPRRRRFLTDRNFLPQPRHPQCMQNKAHAQTFHGRFKLQGNRLGPGGFMCRTKPSGSSIPGHTKRHFPHSAPERFNSTMGRGVTEPTGTDNLQRRGHGNATGKTTWTWKEWPYSPSLQFHLFHRPENEENTILSVW